MTDPRSSSDRSPPAARDESFEAAQRALDPHRDEERRGVAAEVGARLRSRGVHLTGGESPDEMADLLDAVDQFEAVVEARGGDLFVDTPTPQHADRVEQPDDPAFVLPTRGPHESVTSYVGRVIEAADRLR
jgi:hypothetical protein